MTNVSTLSSEVRCEVARDLSKKVRAKSQSIIAAVAELSGECSDTAGKLGERAKILEIMADIIDSVNRK